MGNHSYYLGIDIGSTTSKCAVICDGAFVSKGLYVSGAGTVGPQAAVGKALAEINIELEDISYVCSTGYGRHLLDFANVEVSELSCHARGAAYLFPEARTVVDIGGQDVKVLHVGPKGQLENFVMNDKCAAGTGRFLDVMASIFGCKASELSTLDDQSSKIASISSTCTVFAESEVISKLAAGESVPDVVAGIHSSVAERTYGLIRRLGVIPEIAMSGGVARNESLCKRLEEKLGLPIVVSPYSQYNGALGAAFYAREKSLNK